MRLDDKTKLPVGTRIRFIKTLTSGPTGDHPAFLYARKGEGGVVTGHNDFQGHTVKWDGWEHAAFCAVFEEEFVVDDDVKVEDNTTEE